MKYSDENARAALRVEAQVGKREAARARRLDDEILRLSGQIDELVRERERVEAEHRAELVRERERVEAEHRAEIRAISARHKAAIRHLRVSLAFRIGVMVVDLRGLQGWRRFPRRFLSITRDVFSRLRPRRATVGMAGKPSTLDMERSMAVPSRDSRRVLSILDEFTEACFAPEFNLLRASKSGWRDEIDGASMLFVETSWRGNGGEWNYQFSNFDAKKDLAKLVSDARLRSIPSVIWNKEDPVNYDTFLPAVREFEHVFTTDLASVDRYRKELGHDRVYVLPFAAQPRLHNPIGRPTGSLTTVCFAGAWRGHKYPERAGSLSDLLDAASKTSNLKIYDREPKSYQEGQGFPERFHRYIVGTLPYSEMVGEYRRHACFLNVNSVEESRTMLSRRVFELLACRTPVVSTPSPAIDELLPGVVLAPSNRTEAEEMIGQLITDVDHRDRIGQAGYRTVMANHTYQHRAAQVMKNAGLDGFDMPANPMVDVICVSQRPSYLHQALDNYRRQNYPNTRLVFVTNSDEFERVVVETAVAEFADSVVLHAPAEMTLGDCLNLAIERTSAEFFAKIDDDDYYGANYLSDMILATRFADASVYGKQTFHAHVESADITVVKSEGREFRYTKLVRGGTLLVRRRDVSSLKFESVPQGTDSLFLKACVANGLAIFSTDRFNYLMTRRSVDGHHTWAVDDSEFLRNTRTLGRGCLTNLVLI